MNNSFGTYLTRYFGDYLLKQKGVSENTIKSYRDTFVQLIEFINKKYDITCNKLTLHDFQGKRILCFLDALERDRGISASTRNQRLAAIHSFFNYLQKQDFACYELCSDILSIEFKKIPVPVISYLSLEETNFLFSLPDVQDKHERRDLTILTLLYETGARVQELIDLKKGDVNLNSCPTVTLHGKGNKSRVVPIGKDMASILKKYISDHLITDANGTLFTNRQHCKLSRVGVQYIIDKYVERGRSVNTKLLRGNITNHSFRHSKSMHLLEAGVNLVYIRDFLGHTSVTTTEIYAKSNAEIKRNAIINHSAELKAKPVYDSKEKENLISWLKNNI